MNLIDKISTHSRQPLTHQLLISWLKHYERPNDKISELIHQNKLQSIKKGLYIVGPAIIAAIPEKFTIANHLLGPSYISLDSALSYYGLIPEKVYTTSSVTIKSSKEFDTSIGFFSYSQLPVPYYSFGIKSLLIGESQQILIASKEKALCDKIIKTKGIVLRSEKQAYEFLIKNLRMDEFILKNLNTDEIENWLNNAPKAESISQVVKVIKSL
ncbi:hypothetical protein A5893_15575 [Pedobacter psychrophilus]|uniref:Transcriptional regulator, AbiEi antitoxin, Type IV TA system n=1 Tax=Pedobacter psychrophilus TaxID=1826909 RepID=A0A179DAZ1_9SPHI|nr:hypothetical protein [Pedobacter psychrophilus]OAQ38215.1 hypothetical protein A5893_15575 [Pedobacter psychrophilus]